MYRILLLITLILVPLSAGGKTEDTLGCGNPITELSPFLVDIRHVSGGRGSGIILRPNTILTAAHSMIFGINGYKIDGPGMDHPNRMGTRYSVTGIQRDDVDDLALLTIKTDEMTPLKIADTPLDPYEKVWIVGIPLAYTGVTIAGRFQRVIPKDFNKWVKSDTSFIVGFSAQGMSGGGVFRCKEGAYELAGIVRGVGISRAYNAAGPLNLSVHQLLFATSQHTTKRFIDKWCERCRGL